MKKFSSACYILETTAVNRNMNMTRPPKMDPLERRPPRPAFLAAASGEEPLSTLHVNQQLFGPLTQLLQD